MSQHIKVAKRVYAKLKGKHSVTLQEVRQCFANVDGQFLEDTRECHKTDPVTMWFIAETDKGRALKVCFVREENTEKAVTLYVKTAYEPNEDEVRIYDKYART